MPESEEEPSMHTLSNPILLTKTELIFYRDMPGFIGAKHFVVEPIGDEDEAPFARLRCTDTTYLEGETAINGLTLLVMSPGLFWRDYEVRLDASMVENLALTSADDVQLMVIIHPRDPLTLSTANLYSPIVINRRTGASDQLVPSLTEREVGWSVRTPFPKERDI